MTRDFAGSPAVPPYPKDYLEDAMGALAGFFDYAVNDYGAEGPLVADLFARSTLGRLFEQGAPWVVSGRSGVELFLDLSRELGFTDASAFPPPRWRSGRTAEYWAGWVAAYAHWRLGLTFRRLFEALPFDELAALYDPWHEASEERFVAVVRDRVESRGRPTNLSRIRRAIGYTQDELAQLSGVALRSIQMYEQRNKDINHARAETLASLARALRCPMEDLLEVGPTAEKDAA